MSASRIHRIVLVFALFGIATCGGGGGGGGGVDGPEKFRVVDVRPVDGENYVSQYVRPFCRFSHDVDMASLLGAVTLTGPDGSVSGMLYIDSDFRKVTLDPTEILDLSSTYTLTLASTIKNADGETLGKDRSYSFTTVVVPTIRQLEARDFLPTWGPLNVGRSQHTATLLDDGKVLLTGGFVNSSQTTGTAELYVPDDFDFVLTGNSMVNGRARHTATLLEDGRVLIAGGLATGGNSSLATCEIYDPTTAMFSLAGELKHARAYHTAERLPDGKVVVFGGAYFDDTQAFVKIDVAEIFDPVTGQWSELASLMVRKRAYHTSTVLEDGTILLAGGGPDWAGEIFDPGSLTFTRTSGDMQEWRGGHTAIRLETGNVLLSGGGAGIGEVYLPALDTFDSTSNGLSWDRSFATVAPIRDGGYWIMGGIYFGEPVMLLASMDIFAPVQGPYGRYFQMVYMRPENRAAHTATVLQDDSVLVTGGINVDWTQPELNTAFILKIDD